MNNIYLDNSSTTKMSENVFLEMKKYMMDNYYNPSSTYKEARESRAAIEKSRKLIAELLNVKEEEIFFTSGATEANNWALKGIAEANEWKGNHIITTRVEHKAILNTCNYLEKRGFEITYLNVDYYGNIDMEQLVSAIKDTTILISVMTANNEVGTILPIEEISNIAKKNGIYFHTDAVQALGHIEINLRNVDLLSASAHKIHGPKGSGMLYIRKGVTIENFFHGGSQEKGYRAGTENVPGIVGMGVALAEIFEKKKNIEQIEKKRDYLIGRMISEIEDIIFTGSKKRLPHHASFCLKDISGIVLVDQLSKYGIYVSSGSACNADVIEDSYVLREMHIPEDYIKGAVRLTLSEYTTMEQLDYAIERIKQVTEELRGF